MSIWVLTSPVEDHCNYTLSIHRPSAGFRAVIISCDSHWLPEQVALLGAEIASRPDNVNGDETKRSACQQTPKWTMICSN